MFDKKTPLEKEWQAFLKREEKLVKKNDRPGEAFWEKKLSKAVPDGLREKLETAFYKAFKVILENGTGVIGKSFPQEKLKAEFQVREFAADRYPDRRNLAAIRKKAARQSAASVAGAGAEGAVLGILGIGLPDIPLFLAVLLRSLYALAIHFGIDYENPKEQEFLLDLLSQSLERGEAFMEKDAAMNQRIYQIVVGETEESLGAKPSGWGTPSGSGKAVLSDVSIRRAASALSRELLYLKFLQGIPVAGVIGGVYDGLYLKKITDYASIKLERRWLLSKSRK